MDIFVTGESHKIICLPPMPTADIMMTSNKIKILHVTFLFDNSIVSLFNKGNFQFCQDTVNFAEMKIT